MDRNNILVFCFVVWLVMPLNSWAQTLSTATDNSALRYLRSTVEKILASNPEYQAALATIESQKAQLLGAERPLYNPEVDVELESAEENTYAIGLSQTLDWHDKQSAQHDTQEITLKIADAERNQLAMTLTNDVLMALADYFSAAKVSQLNKQRVGLLEKIVKLAETRLLAGDINKSEVLLARLALADAVIEHANESTNVIQAQKAFYALSQESIDTKIAFQIPLPELVDNTNTNKLAEHHPLEKIALLQIEQAKREVASTKRERKADPSLGITLGKEGDEALVGVQFSMPWQIRNNLSYTVDVAQSAQVQTELEAQNTHRQIIADMQAAIAQYLINAKAWKIWLSNGQSQLKEHIDLLEQLWKSGELSTTDYLVQLEQNLHTQIAGVELQGNVWRAWFEWLSASGQVLQWLTLDKEYGVTGEQR